MKRGVRIQIMIQEAGRFPVEYSESGRSVDGPNGSVCEWEGRKNVSRMGC